MINPFPPFIPDKAQCIVLGSFPPLSLVEQGASGPKELPFFYGSSRNQMWNIMEKVYDVHLKRENADKELDKEATLSSIQSFLSKEKIAIMDIVQKCHRKVRNSDDNNLIVEQYTDLRRILKQNVSIKEIYFTSLFVEKHIKLNFPDIMSQYICKRLISSSPRARGSIDEKAEIYKKILKISQK